MKTNNLDVVYTLKKQISNDELRYSLRSLKNLPHRRVWIVGHKPSWANTLFIMSRPISRNKIANTDYNWLLVANHTKISDPFILMNDDFYINKPIKDLKYTYFKTNKAFENYYKLNYPSSYYTNVINNTSQRLYNLGITDAKCYELHTPMIIYKKDIIEALQDCQYKYNPINIRTAAANIGNYGGIKSSDVKVYGTEKEKKRSLKNYKNSDFISTDDSSFEKGKVGEYLKNNFNKKSEYELW